MSNPSRPFSSYDKPLMTLRAKNAATMWLAGKNTKEIADALKIHESQAVKLLAHARYEEMMP